jgi:alkanesulfonate monooxygenase SsuD/methylene tetrahydromethanopterin reductase-like flavin-dependent oxidoreductase (luciferase family)
VAGEGPKTLTLTGEVADGTVVTGGTTVAQVAAARELIDKGRAAAGRTGRHEIVVYAAVAFGADAATRAAVQLEDWGKPGETDRILVGEAEQVAEGVAKFFDAGADAVILQPLHQDAESAHDAFFGGVAEVARLTG